MTSPLAGKRRLRCDVCLRRFYYVVRTVAALELRPYWSTEAKPAHSIALPAGSVVCDRCVESNGVKRCTNPLPLQKRGTVAAAAKRRQTLIAATLTSPEAERLRQAALELRSIGDALVELGRMRGTHDRLNVLADELVVMSNAAEVADLLNVEGKPERIGIELGGSVWSMDVEPPVAKRGAR